jgi:hypothetical protein
MVCGQQIPLIYIKPCDICLWGSLKEIPTLWKKYETISTVRLQQFPGKNFRELTPDVFL